MHQQLKTYLNNYCVFTDDELDRIQKSLFTKTYKKGEFLLEENKVCGHKFFILKGLVRAFHTDHKGNEKVNLFAIENWWITDMDSLINQKPSFNTIQALENSQVLILSKDDLETLYLQVPKLERVFRLITEKFAIALQRKDEIFMKRNSSQRYFNLVQSIPNFVQRVPQYMIASYLDITPEYLSELRKNAPKEYRS